jgi:Recombination endonuclease VII
MNELTKICKGACGRDLPLDMYNDHPMGRLGKQARCKDCKYEENKKIRLSDPKKAQAASKDWAKRHPEETKAYGRNWARKDENKHTNWVARIKREYGITPEDFYEQLEVQNGACAICGKEPPEGHDLHIDHCHVTNVFRGLLCGNCNRGIGIFQDSPDFLLNAAEYLQKFVDSDEDE